MQEKIIQYLKKSQGYLSGEELSHCLSMTRAGVWKAIQELRKLGYDIAAVPHLGYQLKSLPDRLFPWEIQHNLGTKILGKRIIYHDCVDSTMDEAFQLGLQKSPEGTVVCAETQTKGRGRLGRNWISPKGQGIYASILLKPHFLPTEVSKLTLLCAVAISEAINKTCGFCPTIKWPNDILINDRKVGGILTELRAEADCVGFLIIGLGINVNTKEEKLPDFATSLRSHKGDLILRIELMKEILRSIESWYLGFPQKGFDAVIRKWKELSSTLHRYVRTADASGIVEGEAIDIDQDGGLLIRKGSGVVVKKMAGDVTVLR